MYRTVEPVIDEFETLLETDLQTRIDAMNVAHPDIVLKSIAKVTHGEKRNQPLPAIAVIPGRSPIAAETFDAISYRHRIVLRIYAAHPDEETLTRSLERYTACVIQTISDHRAAGAFTTCRPQFATEQGGEIDWPFLRWSEQQRMFDGDVLIELFADSDELR